MPSSGVQTCALRSEEHTSELQSPCNLVCRPLLEKKRQREHCFTFRRGGLVPAAQGSFDLAVYRATLQREFLSRLAENRRQLELCFIFFRGRPAPETQAFSQLAVLRI